MGKLIGKISLSFLLVLATSLSYGQDIGVVAKLTPNSGCLLGNSLTVTVQVFNFGSTFTSPFDVSYQVDANTPVTETVNLGTFNTSSSYSHTFATDVDLSITGSYVMKFYTALAGDVSNINDTLTVTIVNDPATVGGSLPLDFSVCELGNSGNLNLSGHTGDVIDWEITTNGGASWNSLSNTTTTESYLNLTQTTGYRAIVKSGFCPQDYSSEVYISIDPESIGGTVSGPVSICTPPNAASISLAGHQGNILDWEVSTDGGTTWTPVGDNSNPLNQSNLTQTTAYRAEVQNGTCPPEYSDTLEVVVISNLNGGDLAPALDSVCISGNSGTVTLNNHIGTIDHWESSTDMITWNSIANTTTSHAFSNLLDTTFFRVIVSGCTNDTSTIAQIIVSEESIGGSISSPIDACQGDDITGINASGIVGNSYIWETSTDGTNWTTAGAQSSLDVLAISQSQFARFIATNGACEADTSNVLSINVSSAPSYVSVTLPDSLCLATNNDSIVYTGINSSVVDWIYTENGGASWSVLSHTDSVLQITPTISTTYGVLVSSGTCPIDTFFNDIHVSLNSTAGSIPSDTTICSNINSITVSNSAFLGDITWYGSNSLGGPYTVIGSGSSSTTISTLDYTHIYAGVINEVCPTDYTDTMSIDFYNSNYGITGDTIAQQNTPVTFEAFGGQSYLWNNHSTITDVADSSQTVVIEESISYYVTITDINGCEYLDSITINLLLENVEIATIMTPNNDGFNDAWAIKAPADYGAIKVTVTNTFGQVVYSNDNYQNDWMGDFSGSTLPNGAYYYLVEFTGIESFYGTLNLLTND